MDSRPPLIDRALELAREGYVVEGIKRRLIAEGYPLVGGQIADRETVRKIREISAQARLGRGAGAPWLRTTA